VKKWKKERIILIEKKVKKVKKNLWKILKKVKKLNFLLTYKNHGQP